MDGFPSPVPSLRRSSRWTPLLVGIALTTLCVGIGCGDFCLFCDDALSWHRELEGKGIRAKEPFVGNGLWVVPLTDPDGYRVDIEGPADQPEETALSEIE